MSGPRNRLVLYVPTAVRHKAVSQISTEVPLSTSLGEFYTYHSYGEVDDLANQGERIPRIVSAFSHGDGLCMAAIVLLDTFHLRILLTILALYCDWSESVRETGTSLIMARGCRWQTEA
jgi:hypothetical protein